MPEQFNTFGTFTGTGDFNPQFAWQQLNDFEIPRGQTMREATMGLRPKRKSDAKPVMPVAERVIEFTIEKDSSNRYYVISAIVVNDKNKVLDQWTASTEEDADAMVSQMAEMFMRSGVEGIPMDLRHRDRIRQRGHLTRDDRASLRRNDRDDIAEDSFSLDIDEDAIALDKIADVGTGDQELDKIIRRMERDTLTVPF